MTIHDGVVQVMTECYMREERLDVLGSLKALHLKRLEVDLKNGGNQMLQIVGDASCFFGCVLAAMAIGMNPSEHPAYIRRCAGLSETSDSVGPDSKTGPRGKQKQADEERKAIVEGLRASLRHAGDDETWKHLLLHAHPRCQQGFEEDSRLGELVGSAKDRQETFMQGFSAGLQADVLVDGDGYASTSAVYVASGLWGVRINLISPMAGKVDPAWVECKVVEGAINILHCRREVNPANGRDIVFDDDQDICLNHFDLILPPGTLSDNELRSSGEMEGFTPVRATVERLEALQKDEQWMKMYSHMLKDRKGSRLGFYKDKAAGKAAAAAAGSSPAKKKKKGG
jgi:hypothetical protein